MSRVRRIQRKLYEFKGLRYPLETLVSIATLPRKWRAHDERFERLERVIGGQASADSPGLAVHLPAILNYVTSFAHTSRELTRAQEAARAAVEFLQRTTSEQAEKIAQLERSAQAQQSRIDQAAASAETMSAALSSLTAQMGQLTAQMGKLDGQVGEVWHRIEFVRSETMFELMHGGRGGAQPKAPVEESRVLDAEKLKGMAGHLKLNLGCGHVPIADHLNVDGRELPGVDLVADVRRLPFAAGEVEELYSAHVIEHFPLEELRRAVLPHWAGLIRPGGLFRAIVPDWEAMIRSYSAGKTSFEDLREVTFGGQEYDGDFHYNMFSKQSLVKLLEGAGLHDISFPVEGRPNGKCLELEVRAVK